MNQVISFFNKQQFTNFRIDEPLSNHTSLRVGGRADVLFMPKTKNQLIKTVQFLVGNYIPYKIIGNGSNLLFSDQPFHGVIIKNNQALTQQEITDDSITVGSSVSLIKLALDLGKQGLSGLEFVHSIPGTVGGAIYMNAGAYNKEIKDCLLSVTILDEKGEIIELTNKDINWTYRTSIFQSMKPTPLILEATFKLEKSTPEQVIHLMKKRKKRREETQPLQYPSCGSVFKNPKDHYAWQLIDEVGLRRYAIGGAQFSEKHCNFIINKGQATSQNVKDLIDLAEEKVYQQTNIRLEREVELVNFN